MSSPRRAWIQNLAILYCSNGSHPGYRKTQRELSADVEQATIDHDSADGDFKHWSQTYEALVDESREVEENQVAYETFGARAGQFLPEHRNAPRAAKEWAQAQLVDDRKAVDAHNEKVVALAGKFETWTAVNAKHAGESLPDALAILVERHEEAVAAGDTAREAMALACKRREGLRPRHKAESDALRAAEATHQRLTGLAEALPTFRTLFGDVDPLKQNPQAELATANQEYQDASDRLKVAIAARDKLDGLKPMVKVFREVFGDADPTKLSPVQDLLDQKAKIATEEAILADHQPYVEALSQFRDAYSDETPDHRLEAIGQQRSELLAERNSIKARLSEINVELSDLDTYAVADGRVYTAALDVLTKAGIPFTRLHAVVMDEASNRREAMLSLFSAALSAPVVENVEDADRATEILENAKLTVPVFLGDPLRQFVEGSSYEVTGNVTHTFFVGRSTRQVKILLNPKLIVEEKERLTTEARGLSGRDTEIGRLLSEIDPSSDLVAMVLKARDAIRKGSEAKYAEADGRLGELSKLLPILQRRVESVDSIRAMKEFAALGGDSTWQELVAKTIPHEQGEVSRIELILGRLKRLVEEDASRALIAAKDFYREGGENALTHAAVAVWCRFDRWQYQTLV